MSEYGIEIKNKSSTSYRTDRNTLKLEVRPDGTLNNFIKYKFGANPSPPPGVGKVVYPIHRISHGLGYKPAHLFYSYDYDLYASYIQPSSYSLGAIGITGAGYAQQYFEYYITNTELVINYVIETLDASVIGYTPFDLTGKSFGFKYTIYSNPLDPDA